MADADEDNIGDIQRQVYIRTMGIVDASRCLQNVDDNTPTTLHVDLCNHPSVAPSAELMTHYKVVNFNAAATDVEDEFENKLEEVLLSRGSILIKVDNFHDRLESLALVHGLTEFIYRAFRRMHNCFEIVINCALGKQRSVVIACRLGYRIQSRINSPGLDVFENFQQICQSVCQSVNQHFNNDDLRTYPRLCTALWCQLAIHVFEERVNRYPDGGGVYIENPHGQLQCSYEHHELLLHEERTYLQHLEQWSDSTWALIETRLRECQTRGNLRYPDRALLLRNQLQPRSEELRDDFRFPLETLSGGGRHLMTIVHDMADTGRISSYFRLQDGYPMVQLIGLQSFGGDAMVVTRPDNDEAEWDEGWLEINNLREVTRLQSAQDRFAFNAFCWYVFDPEHHWSHTSRYEERLGIDFDGYGPLTIDD